MARPPAVLGRLNGALLVFIKKCTFASDMEFEWDPEKAKANEQKHDLSFHEGATVFGDPLAITFPDPDHSGAEERYLTFGLSRLNRLVVISHTQRAEKTRIISARLMTRQERKIYEEG